MNIKCIISICGIVQALPQINVFFYIREPIKKCMKKKVCREVICVINLLGFKGSGHTSDFFSELISEGLFKRDN